MKKISFLILLLIIPWKETFPAKMRIAIMDFKADGISKSTARKISELIRSEMVNTGSYQVIERSRMNDILKEQSFQQSGCTDVSCAVEMGKLLSANKMLVGTIMMLNKNIVITGRIIDVEKGLAEFSHNQMVKSDSELFPSTISFVQNLTARIHGKQQVKSTGKVKEKNYSDLKRYGYEEQEKKIPPPSNDKDAKSTASVNGKYYKLIQVLNCPKDEKSYGSFKEWGFWNGSKWCGQKVNSGYWVWVAPNWYIWQNKK